jgi:hypothetical protein
MSGMDPEAEMQADIERGENATEVLPHTSSLLLDRFNINFTRPPLCTYDNY